VKQGNFDIEEAISLADIEENNIKFVSSSKALDDYYKVVVSSDLEEKILNGCVLDNIYDKDILVFENDDHEVLAIYKVYEKDNTKIKPIKVLKKRDE
jgi:hypothetical protein